MKPIKKLLLILLYGCFSLALHAQAYNLTVNVSGLRSNKGTLYISLYNSKEGYPKTHTKAFRLSYGTIANGKCTVSFDAIPKGLYAIACYHDENSNGKLDTNFLGIPKEGTGASNNAKGFMGPASFADAQFQVTGTTTQEIEMNY
jgi:uncharacterized protein (DUF2141 family)